MKTNPRKLPGDWKAGFALDLHTVSSEFVGYNEYGHEQFDTKYSDVGGLLYRLKSRSDKSVVKVLAYTAGEFVKSQKWSVDVVVPVPPSRTGRAFQPVPLLAKATVRFLGIPVCLDCVVKVKDTPELKSVSDFNERLRLLEGAYAVAAPDVSKRVVLLLDDLYRSGATLKAVANSLTTKGNVKGIYVLAFTRTRVKR